MRSDLIVRPKSYECLLGCVGLGLLCAYYWLLDDAFVYFRYVDNCVFLHLGLVYNQDEFVEGFSSPMWTLLLMPLRTMHLPFPFIVMGIGVGAYGLFWYGLVLLNRLLSPSQASFNLPLAFLGLNYPVLCYFTSGLETPLVQLMAVVYALAVVRPGLRTLQCVAAFAPLLRNELLIPLSVLTCWIAWRERKTPWALVLTAFFVNGAWLLFRLWYYADFFPNTYYLKDGSDLSQGLVYLKNSLYPYHFVEISFCVALIYMVALRGRSGGNLGCRLVILALAGPVAIYVVKIGGDARHYRYLAFPLILLACSWGGIIESALCTWNVPRLRRAAPWLALLLAAWSFTCYPPQLSGHPLRKQTVHLRTEDKIADAFGHRWNARLFYRNWAFASAPSTLIKARKAQPDWRYRGVRGEGWCVEAYKDFDVRIVHVLGLTDPVLARVRMASDRPGPKFGLVPLGNELAQLEQHAQPLDHGFLRRAVMRGEAPKWVEENLPSLEIIERKTFNRHALLENLRLAITPVGEIKVPLSKVEKP